MAVETATIIRGTLISSNPATQRDTYVLQTLLVTTDNTADAADTIAVDLAPYGGSVFRGALGWKETTDGSVIATENPTTAVTGTTVTLTIPAGTDNDPRTYKIYFT